MKRSVSSCPPDPPNRRKPLAHQSLALEWALPRPHIALFLEMRLGKSLVAIRWAKARTRPTAQRLIVAPLTTLPSWRRELILEGEPDSRIHTIAAGAWKKADLTQPGWYLLNYESLRVSPQLLSHPWALAILDESTAIRSPRALITKRCLNCLRPPNRAILSGLPAPQSAHDYFAQMAWLKGLPWMGTPSYWAWRSKLFHRDRFDWEPNRGSIQKITEAVAEDAYVLSRNAVGIGSKKVRETRTIPMTSRQKRAYKLARDSFELDYEGRREETQWVLTKLIWMHRLAGGFHPFGSCVNPGKIDELVKLLQGELANEPVVVWFRYLQEIEAVARRLRKLHLPHGCITGATPLATRDAVAEGLQSGRLRAILVQLKCGRYGMNFSRSDTAIYFSSSYESEDRLQSEDRIIHPTKKTPALILDLVTEGSMDQAILSVLQMKRASSRATLRAIAQEVLNG